MVAFLVTGGSGFVGRALVQKLLEDGDARVVVSSRGAAKGGDARLEHRRIAALDAETDWSGALQGVDVVFHCAAVTPGDPGDDADLLRTNRDGTLNMANQAAASGVKRLVFVSTAQVHGNVTNGRAFTEASPPDPQSDYAASKWEAERGLEQLAQESGMPVTIVRPPLVYGPGVKGNLAQLAKLTRLGLPLPLAAVDNRRSLIAIDNLTDFLRQCSVHPAARNETYLISDGPDLSIGEILRHIAHGDGRRVRLFAFPTEVMKGALTLAGRRGISDRLFGSFQIDASKARRQTGWSPVVTPDTARWS